MDRGGCVWALAKPSLKSGLRAPGGQVVQQVRVANVIKIGSLEFQNRKRANSLDSGLNVNRNLLTDFYEY